MPKERLKDTFTRYNVLREFAVYVNTLGFNTTTYNYHIKLRSDDSHWTIISDKLF